jgi:hypothetical protein
MQMATTMQTFERERERMARTYAADGHLNVQSGVTTTMTRIVMSNVSDEHSCGVVDVEDDR